MVPIVAVVLVLLFTTPSSVLGFVVPFGHPQSIATASSLHAIDPNVASLDVWNAAQSLWIATIDADIDKIPENEFATVFAGGIVRCS
jgi:hypothetical protein